MTFRAGTNAESETASLAGRYGFAPMIVFGAMPGFAAELTQTAIAGLRCEPTVQSVSQNSAWTP